MKDMIHLEFITERENRTHLHLDLEIVYILKGQAEVYLDKKKYLLVENDFTLINANKKHHINSKTSDTLGIKFIIDYQMLTECMNMDQMLFWCNTTTDEENNYTTFRKTMDQILGLYFEKIPEEQFRVRCLINELLYQLVSNFLIKTDKERLIMLNEEEDSRIFEIRNSILTNYQKQLSLGALAEQMHLSSAYLSRYIKQNFGFSFLDYLNNVRIFHAVDDLVYSDKKMINIAIDNGYPTPAAFNKAFRDYYSMTPSEFRNTQKKTVQNDNNMYSDKEKQKEFKRLLKQRKTRDSKKRGNLNEKELFIADEKESYPLHNPGSEILNICDVSNIMRSNVRDQIEFLQNRLHFKYLRIWNVLKKLIYEDKEGNIKQNYMEVDRSIDFCMEHQLIPYIELGYKPVEVVDREKKLFLVEEELLFSTLAEYETAMNQCFIHLVNRYGVEVVETWKFEMRMGVSNQTRVTERFFECFSCVRKLLKNISPNIMLGGPGIVLGLENYQYEALFADWEQKKDAVPDFISAYSYGYAAYEKDSRYYVKKSLDQNYTIHQLNLLKNVLAKYNFEGKEIEITEWNYSVFNRNVLNDSCAMGAYVLQNLIATQGSVKVMGWWHATDLLTDYCDTDSILSGDNGMLSCDGIQKPVYYAFEFYHKLYGEIIGKTENILITTNGKGSYALVCHNCKKTSYRIHAMKECDINIEDVDELFEDVEPIKLKIRIEHVNPGIYQMKSNYVNRDNGSVQDLWMQLGKKNNLSKNETDYLKHISIPRISMKEIAVKEDTLNFEMLLEPHEIRLVKFNYQYHLE